MTVKELIEKLKKFDMDVKVLDSEGDFIEDVYMKYYGDNNDKALCVSYLAKNEDMKAVNDS